MITDPRDVPGLRLWLSAEAMPAGPVTTWSDLSGLGHDAVNVNGATAGTAPAIAGGLGTSLGFADATAYALPMDTFKPAELAGAGLPAAELFVSCASSDFGGVVWAGGVGVEYSHHPYFDGNCYESFGSAQRPGFAPGSPLNVPHRLHIRTTSTTWQARINEAVRYTRPAGPHSVEWPSSSAQALIGTGGGPGTTYGFNGSIGCVLIYGRELSPTERADVDAWLAANMHGGVPTVVEPDPEPVPHRPWLVSEQLLTRAGADPTDDQPAFRWLTADTITAETWLVDDLRSRSLIGWQITHAGRTSPRDRVGAPVATITAAAWGEYAETLPELGTVVRLDLSPLLVEAGIDEADLIRFTGEVTDVALDTRRQVLTVTAVGRHARNGRRIVDGTSWPTSREGAHVQRTLDAIGSPAGTIDPGRVDVLPPAAPMPAQALLDLLSDSTTGQLVEGRDGRLDWHDAEHRRNAPSVLDLDASELLAGFTWAQRVGDLTNQVTVRYGAGDTAGELVVEDAASVALRDPYPATLDTLLPAPAQAQAIAGLIVGRYGRPVWLLPAVMLDLTRTLPATELGAGVALAHGHKVQLTGLPAGGPYTDRGVFVEGVVETLTPRAWRLSLTVADEQLAGAPMRWRDVPDGVRWADVRDGLRWLDTATLLAGDTLT